jgi:hypothetical protein
LILAKSKNQTQNSFSSLGEQDSIKEDIFYFDEPIEIKPLWSTAKAAVYMKAAPILIVPIEPIPYFDNKKWEYKLIFYMDSLNQLNTKLQVYRATDSYLLNHTKLDINDFTGIFYQVRMDGLIQKMYLIENGLLRNRMFLTKKLGNQLNVRGDCNCFHAGSGDSIFEEAACLIACAARAVVNFFSIGGETDSGGSFEYGYNYPTYNTIDDDAGNNNGGGGGGTSLNNHFDPTIFETTFDSSPEAKARYKADYLENDFTDAEFESLWVDENLFKQVDEFFNNNTFSVSSVKIIKYLIDNHAFANSNNIANIFTILNSNEPLLFPDGSGGPEFEINPIEYLKCFKSRPNSTFKVSVNVSQPVQNDRKVNQGTDAGHTFLTLEQSFDGQTVRKSIGFYPNSAWETVFGAPNQAPLYVNNQLKGYDVSITSTLNESQFMGIVENIRTYSNNGYRYDLHTFNCSTFAINAVEGFGFSLPRTEVPFSKGQGITPSNLAEDIRTMTLKPGQTRDISSGKKTPTSNSSSSDCN